MTTITNFLHTNFLTIPQQKQQQQLPIWVLSSSRSKNLQALKQYIIDHCLQNNKPIVHVDLGISNLGLLGAVGKGEGVRSVCAGLDVVTVYKDKPYYVVLVRSELRQNMTKFANTIITTINTLQSQLPQPQPSTLSLLVQGLQLLSSQKTPASSASLQSFITHLTSLNPVYKQITILKHQNMLLPEHQFALERIGTCITQVEKYDAVSVEWVVKSTVRRYTGFSREQRYVVRGKGNRMKVDKWVAPVGEDQTESHKQMVNQLGFVVKKKQTQQQQALKQMIYPHLRVQNQALTQKKGCSNHTHGKQKKCKNCTSQCQTIRPEDQGLIILDDEQEDDDDIDV